MLRPTTITRGVYKLLRPFLVDVVSLLAPERILRNPYVSAKMLNPLQGSKGYYILPKHLASPCPSPGGSLPVPPPELWEGYGQTEEEYLAVGRQHMESMIQIVVDAGDAPEDFNRVLDFGCAAGRMLRFYPWRAQSAKLWGLDIKADHISWCQQNLGLPFLFATTTTFPHLPFPDDYFDLVYCGSVFTHIMDLPDAWFLELRRVTREGGYLYITIHDRHTLDVLLKNVDKEKEPGWLFEMILRLDQQTSVLSRDYGCFALEGGSWGGYPVPQVFYDVDYLASKWSRLAKLRSVTPEAYGSQTALLFQK